MIMFLVFTYNEQYEKKDFLMHFCDVKVKNVKLNFDVILDSHKIRNLSNPEVFLVPGICFVLNIGLD